MAGIEPARLAARDFKSLVSTYFTTLALPYRNTLKGIYAATDGELATYKGSNAFLYGAQGETRTRKIWLLRPTRIPIPSPGHKTIIAGYLYSVNTCFDVFGG